MPGQGEGWILLEWQAPLTGGAVASYQVERRERPEGSWGTVALAMETSFKLTDQQRDALAEVDTKFTAKIAEKEVFLDGLIAKATTTGNFEELAQLETQKAREITRLNADREEAKEKLRNTASS